MSKQAHRTAKPERACWDEQDNPASGFLGFPPPRLAKFDRATYDSHIKFN
jgi:hypothetical protein